jgi:integrase
MMSKSTAREYLFRLMWFGDFVSKHYMNRLTVDNLLHRIKKGKEDPYAILSSYAAYMQNTKDISNVTLKQRVVTVKNFFEFHDVDISPRRFKLKVKLPRIIRKSKEALSKEDVTDILNACSELRLKTYVMLLAATGMRAVEALSIRPKDTKIDSVPARVYVRGEFTKTRTDRTIFLTQEITQQLKSWLEYKYRKRRVCYELNGRTVTEYRQPKRAQDDLVFALYQKKEKPDPSKLYVEILRQFENTLDRMGRGDKEENNKRRRITFHSMRRFVKTTISDLGYQDFSEYFIGHIGSTYWTRKDFEKAEIFRKIEPYLTFLNIRQLERQGADIQTKVEELEELNQSLRDRDKMKDDAISALSDKLAYVVKEIETLKKRSHS